MLTRQRKRSSLIQNFHKPDDENAWWLFCRRALPGLAHGQATGQLSFATSFAANQLQASAEAIEQRHF
jgi:hypothetical protein